MRPHSSLRFFWLIFFIFLSGCSIAKRGVESHSYYSTDSPNIKVTVNKDFSYQPGKTGEFPHQFLDNERHRIIFFQHLLHYPIQNKVDYYNDPESWIYVSSENFEELGRYTKEMVGEKWYVQEYVGHPSTANCFLARKLSAFTYRYDVMTMMYIWEIPPYRCKDWKYLGELSSSQQQYLADFRAGFAEDLEIESYMQEE